MKVGGGYLAITLPWPAMLRTIWGDDKRDTTGLAQPTQHLLDPAHVSLFPEDHLPSVLFEEERALLDELQV